jgi:sarcosine oxidase gamma subunit
VIIDLSGADAAEVLALGAAILLSLGLFAIRMRAIRLEITARA